MMLAGGGGGGGGGELALVNGSSPTGLEASGGKASSPSRPSAIEGRGEPLERSICIVSE